MSAGQEDIVLPEEKLARFVLQRSRLRPDFSVKPDEFIPYPNPALSVTRHRTLREEELWVVGRSVAKQRNKILCARADIQADVIEGQKLKTLPDPIPNNPNHANITGWPLDKPSQKMIATQIAASIPRAVEAPPEP